MYRASRVDKILRGLREYDAVGMAVWMDGRLRVYLRTWCGMQGSVSIGTAEAVLDALRAGTMRKPDDPLRIMNRRTLPAGRIETCFV